MKLTLAKYNQYQPSVTRIQLSIVSIIKIKVKAEPVMGWRDKLNDYASNKGFDMLYGLFDKDQSGQLDPKELSELLSCAIKQAGGAFTVSGKQASMVMKAADKDGNGMLRKEEVRKIYLEFVKNISKYVPQQ